jgi:hypothetical protein
MEAKHKPYLYAALGIGLLLLVNKAGQVADAIDGLTIKCGYGGAPQIRGLGITFPVKVSVTNTNPTTLPLQGLAISMRRLYQNGTASAPIAATNPGGVVAQNIAGNAVTEFIVPVNTDLISALTEIITDIRAGGLGRYLLHTSIMSAGIKVDLPAQTLTF